MFRPLFFLLLSSALLVAFSGCGDGIDRCVVNGTVTLDGEPIANGEIRFVPVTGKQAGGPIIEGKYSVAHDGGVPVGGHSVRITAYTIDSADPVLDAGDIAEVGGATEYQYIPENYNVKSSLKAEITGDEDPFILDFELKSE